MRAAQLAASSAVQWLPVAAHALAGCRPGRCNVFRCAVVDARGPVFLACPMTIAERAALKRDVRSKTESTLPRRSVAATVVAIALRDGGVRVEARAGAAAAPRMAQVVGSRPRGQRRLDHGRPAIVHRAVGKGYRPVSTPRSAAGRGLRVVATYGSRQNQQRSVRAGRPATRSPGPVAR